MQCLVRRDRFCHGDLRGQHGAIRLGRVILERIAIGDPALEFGALGVRVGCIAPGMIETPMTQGMNQKARDALVAAIPVGRIGVPEDIWLAVKFVLECDYFNGRVIDVDGGLSM